MFSVVAHGGDFWRRNSISSHLLCLRFQCGGVELPRHGFLELYHLSQIFPCDAIRMCLRDVSMFFECFCNDELPYSHPFFRADNVFFDEARAAMPSCRLAWDFVHGGATWCDWKRWIRRKRQWLAILDTQMIRICWGKFSEKNNKKHLDIFVIKVLIPCSAILSWKSWKLVLFAPGHGTGFCCALKSTRTWLLLLKAQNSWTISFSDEATATCRDVRKSYCKLDKNVFFSREEEIQHDKDVAKCCCKPV